MHMDIGQKDFIQEDLLVLLLKKLQNVHFVTWGVRLKWRQYSKVISSFWIRLIQITHNNNGFIKYNEDLFSEADNITYADFINVIVEKRGFLY